MTEHILKTWPAYFDAVKRGDKSFEVRRDDRGFQKGDVVVLQRTREDRKHVVEETMGRNAREWVAVHELRRRIRYVLTGGQFGIEPGYVVLQLEEIE